MPKFSIILPVYNVEKYLKECLNSLVNQTFTDFEAICINDGSTDNSLEILNEYANMDSRFKVISQENQGQGVARNYAIDIAAGDYLLFVDPDDYIDLNALELINNQFQQTDVDIVYFDYYQFKDARKQQKITSFYTQARKHLNFEVENGMIYNWNEINNADLLSIHIGVWSKAYSLNFIKNNKIQFAPNRHGEDSIFSISAMLLAKRVLYFEKALYHYRQRGGSAVNSASEENFCVFDNLKGIKSFLEEHNLYEKYKIAFLKYQIYSLNFHYSNIPEESCDRYLECCRKILSEHDYKELLKEIRLKNSFFENIFSVKNKKLCGKKVKQITILGWKITLKNIKNEEGYAKG